MPSCQLNHYDIDAGLFAEEHPDILKPLNFHNWCLVRQNPHVHTPSLFGYTGALAPRKLPSLGAGQRLAGIPPPPPHPVVSMP
jgi:hypothetical protein